MNNKTYLKNRRKKSIASFILAFLLAFTFNSSPLIMLSNLMRPANAYKSSDEKKYYTSTTGEKESGFGAQYTELYGDLFADPTKNNNFNVYAYYVEKFDEYSLELADNFLSAYTVDNYHESYSLFLSKFGAETLTDFYNSQKDQEFLKYHLETVSVRSLLAQIALEGFPESNQFGNSALPAISGTTMATKLLNLSNFYRLLAGHAVNGDWDFEHVDSIDGTNAKITTEEAFYKVATAKDKEEGNVVGNTHYNKFVSEIEKMIMEKAPAYAFDGTTQDTNIAALIANGVPTTAPFRKYGSGHISYYLPAATLNKPTGKDKNTVYYFGSYDTEDDEKLKEFLKNYDGYYPEVPAVKGETDILLYRKITSGWGYIDEAHPTYYKYSQDKYEKDSNQKKTVYVLIDENTTQAELDTYASLYFKTVTADKLAAEKDYFVNLPYEKDELYFKAIYSNHLYSKSALKGSNDEEKFKTFISEFTEGAQKTSKIYLKIESKSWKEVFIASDKFDAFKEANDLYYQTYKVTPVDKSLLETDDYEAVPTRDDLAVKNGDSYWDLYYQKNKEYFTETKPSTYLDDQYEMTKTPVIPFEMDNVPTPEYDLTGTIRKLYLLTDSTESGDTITIKAKDNADRTYTKLSQTELDNNSNFYVPVPSYIYNNENIEDTYKLYYKHKSTTAKALFVVDDSTDASNNKVYKTLNYNVITSAELKSNIVNYLAVAEGDANYNKNFQLYYKYKRDDVASSKVYILNHTGLSNISTYEIIEKADLADYILIDKEQENSLYESAKQFTTADESEIKLYRRRVDVFVRNTLTDKIAVYYKTSSNAGSASSNEREKYSNLLFIPVGDTELKANPELFVLIDSNDPNYLADTKLYYKYNTTEITKKIYDYASIDKTAEAFDKNDYQPIDDQDPNYQEGKELYYKKIIDKVQVENVSKPTYFYYQSSSKTTLAANSYYVVSFYVSTFGQASASFGIKDTSSIISDIGINNIQTEGKWEKYYVFISTHESKASSVQLYLYLGDEVNGIKGGIEANKTAEKITGSVFFDEIKITKIGFSDFNKFAIDNELIYSDKNLYKEPASPEPDPNDPPEPNPASSEPKKYADAYNNRMYIANSDDRFSSNKFDARSYLSDDSHPTPIEVYNSLSWNDIFDFDKSSLQNILGKDTGVVEEKVPTTLTAPDLNSDGFDMYNDSFTSLWKYYISRDLSSDFAITNIINAYKSGKLEVTTTNKFDEPEKPEEDEDKKEEDKKDEDKKEPDLVYVSNPFNENNFALKLKNTSKDSTLGITSNSFKIKQFGYYKISLWIYSPDLEGKATISVNSILSDRQFPVNGALHSGTISSTYANVHNSSSKTSEYGWIPVTLYIEGNNFADTDCYLVLSADKDCTVYFDNIRIEKTTFAQYDTARKNTSSNKYSSVLSLTPTSSLDSTDLINGTFDYVTEDDINHDVMSLTPYKAKDWTTLTASSDRVVAGIVSTQNKDFFKEYSKYGNGASDYVVPTEYAKDISNVYVVHSPSKVKPLNSNLESVAYKHYYSMYSSASLKANSLYEVSFKFFRNRNFTGTLVANLYAGSFKDVNLVSTIKIESSDSAIPAESWQTFKFYVSTSKLKSTSETFYLEIGVTDANETCFFKSARAELVTGETINSLIQKESAKIGLSQTPDVDLVDLFKNIRFLNLSGTDFGSHSINKNEETDLYDPKSFTNTSDVTKDHTAGKVGVTVASYFSTVNNTTYSTVINKVTYYIGEVYEVEINGTKYYIHRTYDSAHNVFEYDVYSDSTLKTKVTEINDLSFEIKIDGSVKLQLNSDPIETYTTTTTYRLFKFSDLREEVTEIGGSTVSVPNLDTVIVGKGDHATENAITTQENTSYIYNFGTSTQVDYEINNNIIPVKELHNNQSGNVLILANGYETDYAQVIQTATNTLGKSTYNVLRIYVKTSDFASDNIGLNIEIDAIKTKFENINTTKSEYKDGYGFVCYEVLIASNSTDSISSFGVKLSLGNSKESGLGYAIISEISLETLSSKEIFDHYSAIVGEDNECVKRAIYTDTASDTKKEEKVDDKNSVSWATFFYIFSSILLVVTLAVALVAFTLKRHPIKMSEKYENDHDRDIQTTKTIKTTKSRSRTQRSKDEIIVELDGSTKSTKDSNDGGIV